MNRFIDCTFSHFHELDREAAMEGVEDAFMVEIV